MRHVFQEGDELRCGSDDDEHQEANRHEAARDEPEPCPTLSWRSKERHEAGEVDQAVAGEGDHRDKQVGSGQLSGLQQQRKLLDTVFNEPVTKRLTEFQNPLLKHPAPKPQGLFRRASTSMAT